MQDDWRLPPKTKDEAHEQVRELSTRLGIEATSKPQANKNQTYQLTGTLKQAETQAEIFLRESSEIENACIYDFFISAVFPFLPRLGVDLHLRARGFPLAAPLETFVSDDLHREFQIRTSSENYVAQLLSGKPERSLLQAAHSGFSPEADHRGLRLSGGGAVTMSQIEDVLAQGSHISNLIQESARGQVSPIHRRVLATFAEFKARYGGKINKAKISYQCETQGGQASVLLEHPSFGTWLLTFELSLAQPYPLRLIPETGLFARWFNADVATGDKAFDRDFLVQAISADVAPKVLNSRVRTALRDFAELGHDFLVTNSKLEITVPYRKFAKEQLHDFFERFLEVGRAFAYRESKHAYR